MRLPSPAPLCPLHPTVWRWAALRRWEFRPACGTVRSREPTLSRSPTIPSASPARTGLSINSWSLPVLSDPSTLPDVDAAAAAKEEDSAEPGALVVGSVAVVVVAALLGAVRLVALPVQAVALLPQRQPA